MHPTLMRFNSLFLVYFFLLACSVSSFACPDKTAATNLAFFSRLLPICCHLVLRFYSVLWLVVTPQPKTTAWSLFLLEVCPVLCFTLFWHILPTLMMLMVYLKHNSCFRSDVCSTVELFFPWRHGYWDHQNDFLLKGVWGEEASQTLLIWLHMK